LISGRISSVNKRKTFWKYCIHAAGSARARARSKGVPFSIDSYFIDGLLVDQQWRCAISGVPLVSPRKRAGTKDPFGPSLDRIIPSLGYVPGNVRIVSNIVNSAMMDWGSDVLLRWLELWAKNSPRTGRTMKMRKKEKFSNDFNEA